MFTFFDESGRRTCRPSPRPAEQRRAGRVVMVVHRGVWTVEDRAEQPYRYLPVEVAPGCPGLTVQLRYDRSAAVLDLGCLGPAGFRGWSGGERDRYVITPAAATPGYLPGELEPGTWQVVLGLHRVGPGGVPYEVRAATGPADPPRPPAPATPPAPARPPRRELPAEPGLRWLAGDLHTHTVHSDGALTVDELARVAAGRGLDYLAVTDHNTTSHHAELPAAARRAGITLLAGQEVTTDRGHAGVLGDVGWIDFRQPARVWLAESARRGGLMSVSHPLAGDCAWQYPLDPRPPLAEVWHWSWLDRRWGGPLAWWHAWGHQVTPVGGSDWHRPGSGAPPGEPTTWVASADPSCEGVLDGLRAGRTAISAGRDAPVLLRVGSDLVACGAEDATLLVVAPDGRRTPVRGTRGVPVTVPAGAGPHLLTDPDGTLVSICA